MSIIVPLYDHPAFRQRWLARQARRLSDDCREADRKLTEVHSALIRFEGRLAQARRDLAPARADSEATLRALESGDIEVMKAVRDAILRRLAEQDDDEDGDEHARGGDDRDR